MQRLDNGGAMMLLYSALGMLFRQTADVKGS